MASHEGATLPLLLLAAVLLLCTGTCLCGPIAQANQHAIPGLDRINSDLRLADLHHVAHHPGAAAQMQQHLARRLLGNQAVTQFSTSAPAQCSWEDDQCSPLLSNFYMYAGQPSNPFKR